MRNLLLVICFSIPLAAAEPRVSDLAWMAGHWQSESDGVVAEEVWTTPSGGVMLGLHRDVKGDRVLLFEFLRIAETEDGIVYFAQPGGGAPTPFRLVASTPGRAVFENPAHDFPKRIIYALKNGRLCATIHGDDDAASSQWCWTAAR